MTIQLHHHNTVLGEKLEQKFHLKVKSLSYL